MNKEQFMNILDRSLKKLPDEERQDILCDFEEHFAIGKQDGKTEEAISASLGSPKQIAKEMLAARYLDRVETSSTAGNFVRAAWAVIGLGFFNLVLVLAPFILLVSVVISGWAAGLSLLVSPVLVIINLAIYPESFELFYLFASLALAGVGLWVVLGMLYASRLVIAGFVKYLRYNVNLVKGGLKHD